MSEIVIEFPSQTNTQLFQDRCLGILYDEDITIDGQQATLSREDYEEVEFLVHEFGGTEVYLD